MFPFFGGGAFAFAAFRTLFAKRLQHNYTNDTLAITDETTFPERLDLSKELLAAGQKELARASQPSVELTVDAIAFYDMPEFKPFIDEMRLGRAITIERDDDILYEVALVSVECDLDTPEGFSLTFSSAKRPSDTTYTYADLIKKATATTRTVASNWSNLMDYTNSKEELTSLISAPLDLSLRTGLTRLSGQEFVIDTTGILGRRLGSDGNFEPKQVRIINNQILFTNDSWSSAALALGEVTLDEHGTTAYGLVADVLVGHLLLGDEMQIRNESGTILLDAAGITIKDENGNKAFSASPGGDVFAKGEIQATSGTIGGITFTPLTSVAGEDDEDEMKMNTSALYIKNNNVHGNDMFFGVINEITTVNEQQIITQGKPLIGFGSFDPETLNVDTTASISTKIDADGIRTPILDTTMIKADTVTANSLSLPSADQSGVGFYLGFGNVGTPTKYYANLEHSERVEPWPDGWGESVYQVFTVSITDAMEKPASFPAGTGAKHIPIAYKYRATNLVYRPEIWVDAVVTIEEGKTSGSYEYKLPKPYIYLDCSFDMEHKEIKKTMSISAYTRENMITVRGDLVPYNDLGGSLGMSNLRWSIIQCDELYTTSGGTKKSDIKVKNSIQELDERYSDLFDRLRPVRYRLNEGTSGRMHTGLIAQDVKSAMEQAGLADSDFAAFCSWKDSDGEETCGLRYDELIALLINEVQKLKGAAN